MALTGTSANPLEMARIGSRRLGRLLGDWRTGTGALHDELAARVRHLVMTGALSSGVRLPSERELCTELGLSRNTVTKALDRLREDGLLQSRRGDGTYVTAPRRPATGSGDRLRTFSATGTDDRIDLRSAALPGLQMVADHFDLLDSARARELVTSHGYVPSGLPELRAAVASYYCDLGLPTEPEHVLITSGAQQALRLVASALVSRGAPVVVEEPTFRGALDSLRALGARLVGVPSGPDGVDVDALARAVEEVRPALVVLQSTVHNPTGSVLDHFRRSRVAALSARRGVAVIDDTAPADTILDGDRRPVPIAAGSELVITVGSLSKSFWGGLRIGWVRAHRDLVSELGAVKGGEDLGTSLVAQLLGAQLLPQVERARDQRLAALGEARRSVLDAVAEHLPDWHPHVPHGGGSLWVRLPRPCATRFVQHAERHGVRVLAGPTFSASDQLDDHLRIAYAGHPEVTARGVELLGRAWATWQG